jgi:dimethylargininase
MLIALTRRVSPSLGHCELTYLTRKPIDVAKAVRQHQSYEQSLRQLGAHIVSLPVEPDLPDAVFVEDTAVVVDEVAVVAHMGAIRRRAEIKSLTPALAGYRRLEFLEPPATLEGGDVVRVGRTLFVGESKRTNAEGIARLRQILEPFDYQVRAVKVHGCLHLSTGCSSLGRNSILINRAWADASPFDGFEVIDVPETEPWAANTLVVNGVVLQGSAYTQTRALIEERGFRVATTDISELEKAEAGLTCMSLIFNGIPQTAPNGNGDKLRSEQDLLAVV